MCVCVCVCVCIYMNIVHNIYILLSRCKVPVLLNMQRYINATFNIIHYKQKCRLLCKVCSHHSIPLGILCSLYLHTILHRFICN